MGVPGRKPKPKELRILEGNPGHRPIPEIPESDAYKPAMPKYFTVEAKQEWNRKVDELFRLGLLTKLNHTLFETLCVAFGEFKKAVRAKDNKNALSWLKEYRMLCGEFGMSPAAIMKMPVRGGQGDDDWGGILD